MKVYHVSEHIFKSIKEFIPRIPKSRLVNEDDKTNRICVGLSIENCLCGLHYEVFSRELLVENKYLFSVGENKQDCYEFVDGFRSMKVYEFECNPEDIIKPNELTHLVPDALQTKEHWLTKKIKPIKEYIINIECFDFTGDMMVSNVKYSIVSEEDFYKKAIIKVDDNTSFYEAYDYAAN